MRVLVASHDESEREYLTRLVPPEWEVLEARTGEEALELYRKELPAIVLSEVVLPGMDGLALLEAVRTFRPDQPFFLISSLSRKDIVEAAKAKGATYFFVKPVNERLVTRKLRECAVLAF